MDKKTLQTFIHRMEKYTIKTHIKDICSWRGKCWFDISTFNPLITTTRNDGSLEVWSKLKGVLQKIFFLGPLSVYNVKRQYRQSEEVRSFRRIKKDFKILELIVKTSRESKYKISKKRVLIKVQHTEDFLIVSSFWRIT